MHHSFLKRWWTGLVKARRDCMNSIIKVWCTTAHTGWVQGRGKSRQGFSDYILLNGIGGDDIRLDTLNQSPTEEVKKPHKRLISFSSSIAPTLYRLSSVSRPSLGWIAICNLHKTKYGNRLQTSLGGLEEVRPTQMCKSGDANTFLYVPPRKKKKAKQIWLNCRLKEILEGFSELSSKWLY